MLIQRNNKPLPFQYSNRRKERKTVRFSLLPGPWLAEEHGGRTERLEEPVAGTVRQPVWGLTVTESKQVSKWVGKKTKNKGQSSKRRAQQIVRGSGNTEVRSAAGRRGAGQSVSCNTGQLAAPSSWASASPHGSQQCSSTPCWWSGPPWSGCGLPCRPHLFPLPINHKQPRNSSLSKTTPHTFMSLAFVIR